MAALPYMQLYVAEYLADTTHLKAAEHGAYLLLLMNYWQRGKPLPDLNDRLATVARMSNEEWNACRETLAEFFEISNGVWNHRRVERDLLRVNGVSEAARRAGIASGNARKQKTSNGRSQTVATESQRNGNHTDTYTYKEQIKKELPQTLAKRIQERTSVLTESSLRVLTSVCRAEIDKGYDGELIVTVISEAWHDYQSSASELSFTPGADKFFGEGMWRDRNSWAWRSNGNFKGKTESNMDAARLAIQAIENRAAANRSGSSPAGEISQGGLRGLRDGPRTLPA